MAAPGSPQLFRVSVGFLLPRNLLELPHLLSLEATQRPLLPCLPHLVGSPPLRPLPLFSLLQGPTPKHLQSLASVIPTFLHSLLLLLVPALQLHQYRLLPPTASTSCGLMVELRTMILLIATFLALPEPGSPYTA